MSSVIVAVGRFIQGFFSRRRSEPARAPLFRHIHDGWTLRILRDACSHRSKVELMSMFGPPRTAVVPSSRGRLGTTQCWRSDTWYYVVDPQARVAMAIEFDDGVARNVEFIEPPQSPE